MLLSQRVNASHTDETWPAAERSVASPASSVVMATTTSR